MLNGKRWIIPDPHEVARAKLMDRLETTHCEDCTRHPGAHSAVLQVRGMPKEELEKILLDELIKTDKKGKLEKIVPKGENYHLTSKSMARSIGKKLHEMGAEIKETSKIVTYDAQRSRQLTRITVRAVFDFVPGDLAKYRNNVYLVEKVKGSFIFTQSGKKFKAKDAKKIEDAEKKKGFYISSNPPLVFIEDTKESLEVPKEGKGKAEVIKYKDKVWVR